MPGRPPPTCSRAARGPMLVRMPRLEARTRTPGAIFTEKPMTPPLPSSSLADRNGTDASGNGGGRSDSLGGPAGAGPPNGGHVFDPAVSDVLSRSGNPLM